MSNLSQKNIHKEHRIRMRERYRKEGIDGFSAHEVLEMVLYQTIPLKDTNELAHMLLNHYGSFANVLDADYDDLLQRKGIGEVTASNLKLLPDLFRLYSIDKVNAGMVCTKIDRVAEFLISYYTAVIKEIVVIVLLNSRNEKIDCVKLHEGTLNSSVVDINKIAEIVYARKAANFILAHNHPNGDPNPSHEDIITTRMINNAFNMFNVKMLAHYIITGTRYTIVEI